MASLSLVLFMQSLMWPACLGDGEQPNKREAADSSGFVSFSGGLPSLPSCPANRLPYPGAAMSSASPSRSARQRDLEIEGEREREQERQGE